MVACSCVSWGRRSLCEPARAEGANPSSHGAKLEQPGWGAGRVESHSMSGSRLFHPWFGNHSSPKGSWCHTQCHRPVLISSCCAALQLTPCWHRCLLNKKLHAMPPTPSSAWTSCLPGFVFPFKPFPLIDWVCLYTVKQLLTPLQSHLEGEGLVQVVLLGSFNHFHFPVQTQRERVGRRERQRDGRLLTWIRRFLHAVASSCDIGAGARPGEALGRAVLGVPRRGHDPRVGAGRAREGTCPPPPHPRAAPAEGQPSAPIN